MINELEALIDKTSLSRVLDTIATICTEKADHIRSNYGDEDPDADMWDEAADALSDLVSDYEEL